MSSPSVRFGYLLSTELFLWSLCRLCLWMLIKKTSSNSSFFCIHSNISLHIAPLCLNLVLIVINGIPQTLETEPNHHTSHQYGLTKNGVLHVQSCLAKSGHFRLQYTPTVQPCRITTEISLSRFNLEVASHCNCPGLENNGPEKQHLHEISVFIVILLWHISGGD